MVQKVFAVYDEKAQAYLPPFYFPQVGQALRAFMAGCNDVSSNLAKYPSDYRLYCLGSFDDSTGHFMSLSVPEFINSASDFVNVPQPKEVSNV